MFITRRRRSRSGVTITSPSTLFAASEQGGWWDPSDFSTMFQDAAGITPVTAAGQTVGRINDKSGRGNHLTNKFTSGPVLTLDAGNKYYLASIGTSASSLSSVGAFNVSASDKAMAVWGIYKGPTAGPILIYEIGPGSDSNVPTSQGCFALATAPFTAGQDTPINAGNPVTTPMYALLSGGDTRGLLQVLTVQIDNAQSPTQASILASRRNGASISASSYSGTSSTGNMNSTQSLFVNSRADTGNFFDGRWYGGIIRGGLSSAAQVSVAENYINSKMGAF